MSDIADIFIIGGGINGVGIAADAAGRGLSVVLAEQNDLGSGTSSASTKLIHGGLRYLEHYEFMLVRKALIEREVLLEAAPHIISPMRFLLPQHRKVRSSWLVRLGLYIYDHLGGRKILPPTETVDLRSEEYEGILKPEFKKAFEYSDCWVDDSRLVVLNAMVARDRGAIILPRHKCIRASRTQDYWHVGLKDGITGEYKTVKAKVLINAAGPWLDQVIDETLQTQIPNLVRLVKGSHIIVPKMYDHDRAYLFQGADGRIVFSIPYEGKYTLIGTTDEDFNGDLSDVSISDDEINYLCEKASVYFNRAITPNDVQYTYAGVRPLYNDGASAAQEATRDFILRLNERNQLLSVIGGKITTYRVLAEKVLEKLDGIFPKMKRGWTADSSLPGGEFKYAERDFYLRKLKKDFPFLSDTLGDRLFTAYGLKVWDMLDGVLSETEMGLHFGAGLYEIEVRYLIDNEWAMTAEDVLWRRTKIGIHLSEDAIGRVENWFSYNR